MVQAIQLKIFPLNEDETKINDFLKSMHTTQILDIHCANQYIAIEYVKDV